MERGERPGNVVPAAAAAVYKAAVRNPAVKGGAPKGYRIIYYVIVRDEIYLLTMYSKRLAAAAEARHKP
ncbi:MAG: hypothetical protein OXI77_06380 [Chloroflexota bacterium]|nr:hypothetical protein [Chloroflexota bacterium]MDE2909835.1 hypothetical protein [Chloroflexota bacterium]